MLQIDGVTILLQIINFLVFLYLLSRLLYKPLRARLAERAARVEGMLENAAKLETENYALQRQLEHRLAEIEQEAEFVIGRAEAKARQQSEATLRATQEKADALLARIQREAEQARLEALQANYAETLDTIFDLASGVLRAVTVRQTHDNLVLNFDAYIWQSSAEEVAEHRRALAQREPITFVYTPVPLTESQEKIIKDTLSSLADRHIDLEIRLDPSLIAGLRVRIGDRIIDNSLRKQLDAVRDEIDQQLQQRLGIAA